ncbi:32484_t:CDS:1, partial [Gigaspora margarita]
IFSIQKLQSIFSSKGTDERKQLHEDYLKDFSELRRVFGLRERYGRQLFSEKKLA